MSYEGSDMCGDQPTDLGGVESTDMGGVQSMDMGGDTPVVALDELPMARDGQGAQKDTKAEPVSTDMGGEESTDMGGF